MFTPSPHSRLLLGALALAASTTFLPAVTYPLTWRWSNPSPHGADIFDFAYSTNGLAVQIGERGQVYTSTDFETWTPRVTQTTRSLRGVTFLGGRLVVSGESGTILYADSPAGFTLLDLGTTDWLESVAASTNLLVAVGDNGAVYTSTNAANWQRRTVSFTTWLRGVTWGPSGFVTVGENGFIATSANGINWSTRSSGTTVHLNRAAWVNDRYWAVGDGGKSLTSVNGSSWQNQTSGATNVLSVITGSSTMQLVAGEQEVRLRQSSAWTNELRSDSSWPPAAWSYYSGLWDEQAFWIGGASGLTAQGYKTNSASPMLWYVPDNSVRRWLWAVTRTPWCYLAVGDRGTVMASDNGLDWELDLVPDSMTNTVFLGVGGSSNQFFAVGSGGAMLRSTNAVTWEAVEPRPATNDLQAIVSYKDLVIAAGAKGLILSSVNGTNWTKHSSPTTQFLSGLTAFPGGLAAVGDNGTILTSPDGTNWTSGSITTTNWFWQVRWLNGVLVLVGENGSLRTSTNGTTWTAQTTGTSEWLTDITFLDDTWLAVGTYGTVLASTNLTSWSVQLATTRKALFGAATSGGQLLTVGAEGVILRSQVVPDASPVQFVSYAHVDGYNLFLLGGKPDQKIQLLQSTNLTDWLPSVGLEFNDGTGTILFTEDKPSARPHEFYRGVLVP